MRSFFLVTWYALIELRTTASVAWLIARQTLEIRLVLIYDCEVQISLNRALWNAGAFIESRRCFAFSALSERRTRQAAIITGDAFIAWLEGAYWTWFDTLFSIQQKSRLAGVTLISVEWVAAGRTILATVETHLGLFHKAGRTGVHTLALERCIM